MNRYDFFFLKIVHLIYIDLYCKIPYILLETTAYFQIHTN